MISECDFLKNLYDEFMNSPDEENEGTRRQVGQFIDSSAIWSKEGSSYRVRLRLQNRIKLLVERGANKITISVWVEAFEKIENYIREKKRNKQNVEPAEYDVRVVEFPAPNESVSEEIGYMGYANVSTPIWTNYSTYYSTTTATACAYSTSPTWYSGSAINITTGV